MPFLDVLILSFIQGLTEFLPVSSSAHLIFPSTLFGMEDQGIEFDVAVHFGTLLAVVLYYMADLVKISTFTIEACVKRTMSPVAKIGFCIIIGTIPACIAGLLFEKTISTTIRDNIHVIAYATIGFGLLLGLASKLNSTQVWRNIAKNEGERADSLRHLSFVQALVIGLFQAIAIIPGTSRSGITLTAGLFLGLKREAAARFSFLLSIPIILASTLFEILKLYKAETLQSEWLSLIMGALISFIFALIVIHLFLKYISRSGMAVFVIYRVLLGAVLLYMF